MIMTRKQIIAVSSVIYGEVELKSTENHHNKQKYALMKIWKGNHQKKYVIITMQARICDDNYIYTKNNRI